MRNLVPIAQPAPANRTAILPDKPVQLASLVAAPPVPTPAPPVVVPALPIATTTNATFPPSVTTSPLVQQKRSGIVTATIPALTTFTMQAYGNRFQLLKAPCPVPIRYESSSGFATYPPGFGIMIDTQSAFTQLELQNTLNVSITVTVFFGWDDQSAFITPTFPAQNVEGLALIPGGGTGLPFQLIALTTITGHYYFKRGFFYGLTAVANSSGQAANVNNQANINIGRAADVRLGGLATINNMPDIITPGGWVEYDAPEGQMFDLASFWVIGTSGDNIFYVLT
jgi:hypothetical protein